MKTRRSMMPSRKRLAGSKWLSIALVALFALPSPALASPRGSASPTKVGAQNLILAPSIKFDIVVNSTGDGDVGSGSSCDDGTGLCTLRSAIRVANAAAGDDVISFNFPSGDQGCAGGMCTINLGSALPDLSDGVTINGTGPDKLTVQRDRNSADAYRIFNVTTTGTVTVSGMTVSNGSADNFGTGGGINNASTGTVNVTNCTLRGNSASGDPNNVNFPGGTGGGIANSTGTVNVTNCTISGNTAGGGGGGIVNAGTLNVVNSTLSGNFGLAGGGGIYTGHGATVTISNSILSNNSASTFQGGGGIFNGNGATVAISSSTLSGNSSRSSGGAIYNSGMVTVSNTAFSGNSATGGGSGSDGFGGAIYSLGAPGSTTITITNCTLSGNSANGGIDFFGDRGGAGRGGAIYASGSSTTLTITNSTVSGNSANGGAGSPIGQAFGGGISAGNNINVKSTIIANNTASTSGADVLGSFTTQGFNLIGIADGSTGFTAATDQTGTISAPLDPKLDPAGLQNNGGPTKTIALQPGSPAIDKGTKAGLTGTLSTDQRGTGFPRTLDDPAVTNADDGTDIGAFELQPSATPTPTPTPSPTPTPTPTPTSTPTPSPTPTATPTPSPTPTPTPPTFQFDSAVYAVQEGCTSVTVRVLRNGPAGASAAVDITSDDGTAKQKGDYTLVAGHLVFGPADTEKTFQVLVSDDGYTEGSEFATLILQHPQNGTLGALSTATLQITDNSPETSGNPIDDSRTFVGQHYHDFLYRQSDQPGEDFWTQQIESCGSDSSCRQSKRVDVSTAFFLSIEFQNTGYFVIRAHKAAFGDLKSNPRYEVFLRDQREIADGVIVGQAGFQQQLEANKQAYLADFASRPEFVALFPQGQSASNYIDALFTNAGATPTQSERGAAISAYGAGDAAGRAAALRSVVESGSVFNAEYNSAFVLMQYYGYLRRNPDDPPDNNFSGYDFWLNKLNSVSRPGEDVRDDSQALARVRRAEMVRAFIASAEYRQRFGGAPGGNQQGPVEGADARRSKWRDALARAIPPSLTMPYREFGPRLFNCRVGCETQMLPHGADRSVLRGGLRPLGRPSPRSPSGRAWSSTAAA